MPWNDPGVTEANFLQESPILIPAMTGGIKTLSLQRAGFLKALRLWYSGAVNVSAYTSGSSKSPYGPLGGGINRIRVTANGQIPLVDLSGFGLQLYDEIQNRDGSTIFQPTVSSVLNVAAATALELYPAIAATGDKIAGQTAEIKFALPILVQQRMVEMGLWLLQNQAIDTTMEVVFNPLYQAAASYNALWSGGTLTATMLAANSFMKVERELYSIPVDPKDFPPIAFAHQIVEFDNPIGGSTVEFQLPRAGLILRVAVMTLNASGAVVDISDIANMRWIYGANETPIDRPGWALLREYLTDYDRLPPQGLALLDFYKWGWEGLKLVKNAEATANLRLQTVYTSTTSGTQKIIVDRLVPVASR